jgi:hypothetical protein
MGHLTKWLFFNLMFGAIPYTLTVALNQLQSPGSPLLHPSSEVLFIAVVATSSALGELWDGEDHSWSRPRSPWRGRWQLFLFLGVLTSSLLYGAYVYHSLLSPGRAHGIDCAAVSTLAAQAGIVAPDKEMVAAWSGPCDLWVRVQGRFFLSSLWVTGFWILMSTAGVYLFPARRGGRRDAVV